MSDKFKGIKPPKPTRPALYRNKKPSEGGAIGSEAKGSSGYQGLAPKKVKNPVPGISFTDKPSAKAQEAYLGTLPSNPTGSLAEVSHYTQPITKVGGHLAAEISNPIRGTGIKQPDLPKAPSLSDQIKNLGDLAKITPSMARTRPITGKGLAIGANGEPDGPEYDTKIEKSHSLKMRYRIPAKLERLAQDDPDTLKKLGNHIMSQVFLEETEREQWLTRLISYRQSWQDFVSAGLDPAFEGAHNVHVPATFSSIKAMHSRIFQAVMGIKPAFSLKPRTKVPETFKEDKEELLNWVIESYANKGDGWEQIIDQDIWNFVGDGTSITKQYWLKDVRKFTDVEEQIRRPIQLDQDGYPIVDEKEIEKEELLFDCPILEPVKLEDLYIIGRKATDIDDADMICHSQQYTKSDLIKMAKLGFFFQEQVDEVIEMEPSINNPSPNRMNTAAKQLDDFTTGLNKLGTQAGAKMYNIYETYLRYDIDDDGIDEEIVAWVEDRSKRVLRITYLERVGPGSKRPFVLKKFIPQPGPYGKGLGEILYGLNNELDYIHNQRLDYGTLQNLPFFFYRAASGLNPISLKLGPGMGVPVDDPQGDINFPRLNGGTSYGFQEEAQVTRYSENASGITQFTLGNIQQQGATRTATGTAALVNELNANIDIHIKRYQRGYRKNLIILDLQLQDLLPLGTIIRVVGMDGQDIYKRFENREAIRWQADFDLTANSINSNKAIERETAQMLIQQLANPIALQTGIANQDNLYAAYKNLLQKFEIRDIDAYITKPENSPESPFSAKDEINMIIVGVEPPLVVKDRHQEKLAFFDEFEQSEDFSWMTEGHIPLYQKVRQYHEQMANAIAAQAQNPLIQNGISNPALAGQLAAGAGAPNGVAQQQSDLGQAGGQLNQQAGQGKFNGNLQA
jgi:hypothetical protein